MNMPELIAQQMKLIKKDISLHLLNQYIFNQLASLSLSLSLSPSFPPSPSPFCAVTEGVLSQCPPKCRLSTGEATGHQRGREGIKVQGVAKWEGLEQQEETDTNEQ